jgi:hypothetical protein
MTPFETAKMKAKAALQARAENRDPQPPAGDRQSPRSRFGAVTPRTPAAE